MANENNLFRFGQVVFFGRAIEEYVNMFDLDLESMRGMTVLDCPSGPAAFAMQAEERQITVTACDPMYNENDVATLRRTVDSDAANVSKKQIESRDLFHPELVPTAIRREAMELFLEDYESGRASGRYMPALLPSLPFEDGHFDISLSANFLFLYSDTASGGMLENSPFDYDFHSKAINELLRVSKKEVRLYPLQGPGLKIHSFIAPISDELKASGFSVEVRNVAQRDIIGAEQCMIISRL